MTTVRKSKKRDAIYRTLQSTRTHPTAEWIYTQLKPEMPDLSLGTVYRNLSFFQREGSAACVATVNGQERFDACVRPHAHFICRLCGAVHDFGDVPAIARPETRARIESVQLCYRGVCASCAEKQGKSPPRD